MFCCKENGVKMKSSKRRKMVELEPLYDEELDFVRINVNGLIFETYKRTLQKFPDTLLGDAVRREEYYIPAKDAYFFLNRDPTSFQAILYYYQSDDGVLLRPCSVPLDKFYEEIKFFELGNDAISLFFKSEGLFDETPPNIHRNEHMQNWRQNILDVLEFTDSKYSKDVIARIFGMWSLFIIFFSILICILETEPAFRFSENNAPMSQMSNATNVTLSLMHKVNVSYSAYNASYNGNISVNRNTTDDRANSRNESYIESNIRDMNEIGYENGNISLTKNEIGYKNGNTSHTKNEIGYKNGNTSLTKNEIGYNNGSISSNKNEIGYRNISRKRIGIEHEIESKIDIEEKNSINHKYDSGPKMDYWFIMELFCVVWFTVEYLIRFSLTSHKRRFMKSYLNFIDLAAIIPYYILLCLQTKFTAPFPILRLIRVLRLFRLFKLYRHFSCLQVLCHTLIASINELIMLIFFLAVGIILFSSAMYYAEHKFNPMFSSIPTSFWYTVVTMATLGYGDIVPVTFIGKVVGGACALSGVLTVGMVCPIIASNFEFYHKRSISCGKIEEKLSAGYVFDNQKQRFSVSG